MELTLSLNGTQVEVSCNGMHSHSFDFLTLIPDSTIIERPPQPLNDPIVYGRAVYEALFPDESLAYQALYARPERLLIVPSDTTLDAVPWEYIYGPSGFIVLDVPFIRGIPDGQRIASITTTDELHIIAVPANPLDDHVAPLNIDGEWQRLKEVVEEVPTSLLLERTRPPTIEQLRRLVAGKQHRVIHFMGHGGIDNRNAFLCFEQNNGGLATVTSQEFVRRIRGTAFLVTLNACVSATPGETTFSNLAAALARENTPYVLGMRFSVTDEDARTLSRILYSELARGVSVEAAVQQVRLELANSKYPWAIGVPVLYTALNEPTKGFSMRSGRARILEHQPPIDTLALPRAEGTFQGRSKELCMLGERLTGDNRPRLLTIHGGGGQGKTALAREAVERFAHAFPGGVWSISLATTLTREQLVVDLARFLGIGTTGVSDFGLIEQRVLSRLSQRRTLIVLDNVDTLVRHVEARDAQALKVVDFLRYKLSGTQATLLTTSQIVLGWPGEYVLPLEGLEPTEGRRLFCDSAGKRWKEANTPQTETLSKRVDGHPLSLRLLGSAFGYSELTLQDFIKQYEQILLQTEDKYRDLDHRHRSISVSIEASLRNIGAELQSLLGVLSVFHAPFLLNVAESIVSLNLGQGTIANNSLQEQLEQLALRSLLETERFSVEEDSVLFFRLHPAVRLYAEKYLLTEQHRVDEIMGHFGASYGKLAEHLYQNLDSDPLSVITARLCGPDLDRGISYTSSKNRGFFLMHLGSIVYRLGNNQRGLLLEEQALSEIEETDNELIVMAMSVMATIYFSTGAMQQAQEILEQAYPMALKLDNAMGEVAVFSNLANVFVAIGQTQQALNLLSKALLSVKQLNIPLVEARVINSIASVYQRRGDYDEAINYYFQALSISEKSGDIRTVAVITNNIGMTYQLMKRHDEALKYLSRALIIRREIGDRAGEAKTLNNLALVYGSMRQNHKVLPLLEETLSIVQELGDRAGESQILNNLGLVYQEMKEWQKSFEFLTQSLEIRREVNDPAGEADTLLNLAMYYETV